MAYAVATGVSIPQIIVNQGRLLTALVLRRLGMEARLLGRFGDASKLRAGDKGAVASVPLLTTPHIVAVVVVLEVVQFLLGALLPHRLGGDINGGRDDRLLMGDIYSFWGLVGCP